MNSRRFTFLRRPQLIPALRTLGLLVVVAVNGFVFLPDFSMNRTSVDIFVTHANHYHDINKSPFQIQLSFEQLPLPEMGAASGFIISYPQSIYSLLSISILIFISFHSRLCFFRGEESINSQFYPSIIIPPPEKY